MSFEIVSYFDIRISNLVAARGRARDTLFEKLVEINNAGTSVLLVEQNTRKSLEIAHRVYVFKIGVIFLEGEGKELLGNKDVKKVFLGECVGKL